MYRWGMGALGAVEEMGWSGHMGLNQSRVPLGHGNGLGAAHKAGECEQAAGEEVEEPEGAYALGDPGTLLKAVWMPMGMLGSQPPPRRLWQGRPGQAAGLGRRVVICSESALRGVRSLAETMNADLGQHQLWVLLSSPSAGPSEHLPAMAVPGDSLRSPVT